MDGPKWNLNQIYLLLTGVLAFLLKAYLVLIAKNNYFCDYCAGKKTNAKITVINNKQYSTIISFHNNESHR